MKKILILIVGLLFSFSIRAQNSVKIDLDNDGIIDVVSLITSDEGYHIEFLVSSQGTKVQKTEIITYGGQENTLTVDKNVVIINSQFMRAENYFKFRFDKKLKEVILIGFDTVQYGMATNNGSGKSSYNLLTGKYKASWNHFNESKNKLEPLPEISKKTRIILFRLSDFSDKMIDALDQIGYDFLPKILQ